jgi:hypothetical protein
LLAAGPVDTISRMKRMSYFTIAAMFAGCVVAGCSSGKLETGYRYTRLGDSQTKQKSYYASPFSKEAFEWQREAAADGEIDRRPKPGY